MGAKCQMPNAKCQIAIRILIASVITIASITKIWQIATDPSMDVKSDLPVSLTFLVAVAELALAIIFLRSKWVVAWIAMFGSMSVFSLISLYRYFSGATNCGCFGAVDTPILAVLLFDMSSVFVLLILRPTLVEFQDASDLMLQLARSGNSFHAGLFSGFLVFILSSVLLTTIAFGSQTVVRLTVKTPIILKCDVDNEVKILATNQGNTLVSIVGSSTSCGCVVVMDESAMIAPRESREIRTLVRPRVSGPFRQRVKIFLDAPGQISCDAYILGDVL